MTFLFFKALYRDIIPESESDEPGENLTKYVVVWDHFRFQHSAVVRQWFVAFDRMLVDCLPHYSPFLNLIEEF